MLIYAISGFFNAIFGIVFAIFVYSRHKKNRVYNLFYFTCVTFVIWCFGYGMWQLSQTTESALFWCRIFSIGSTLIPISFLHCMVALVEREKKERPMLIFGYLETVFFLFFNFSTLFVNRVEPVFGFLFWPKPGILYTFYILFAFILLLGYGSYVLFKNYREATGIRKELIKYSWLVYLLPVIGGATNFFYWYNIPIPPWGNFLGFLWPVLMGYIISSYRLMDIKLVVGKMMVYILSFISVIVLVVSFFSLDLNFTSKKTVYVLVVLTAILLYQFFYKIYEKLISKYFYKTIYSYQKIISDLERKLVSVLDIDELCQLIFKTFEKYLQISNSAILVCNRADGVARFYHVNNFDKRSVTFLVKNKIFIQFMKSLKTPCLYEEVMDFDALKIGFDKNELAHFRKIIGGLKINLFLPLLKNNKAIGMIVLGEKLSGDYYSVGDISLFERLASQVSIVIENARLYDQVQDLSQNLQKKVDEQTKELKDAYQVEKTAREELEKLDTTKNQFLLATQHHLRTPLTTMRWNADLLLKTKLSKKTKQGIESIKLSTGKLIKMVNEFLDITQFQLGKNIAYLKSEINLQDILKEIISELELERESRKIFIKLENPEKNDLVLADREKLKAALFNIVDNAVKYTTKGGVTISAEKKDKLLLLKVKDTGIGISKENLTNMFNKVFERGQEAQKTFATGRGIGLYIASQIIKAHNGKIWAESEGEGKGSCFYIELPTK